MRASLLAAAGACALALAVVTGGLPTTSSDFDAAATNTGNTFAAAAANAAPTVSTTVLGKTAGGAVDYVKRSGTFYVYANAADDSSVSSVKAVVTNVTGSATVLTMVAGSYTAGGIAYGYRTAQLTASSTLTAGSKSFTATAIDAKGLTGSAIGAATADITAPTATAITTTNKVGGIAGKAEAGDTLSVTYSEAIDPDTIVDGWNGSSRVIQAAIVDEGSGANDVLRVYPEGTLDPNTFLPAGTMNLGRTDLVTTGSYAVFGLSGEAGSDSTMVMSGTKLTVTLGALNYGTANTTSVASTERYTPVTTLTDLAGNAAGTGTIISGTSHKIF
jgi:hypothetical protein